MGVLRNAKANPTTTTTSSGILRRARASSANDDVNTIPTVSQRMGVAKERKPVEQSPAPTGRYEYASPETTGGTNPNSGKQNLAMMNRAVPSKTKEQIAESLGVLKQYQDSNSRYTMNDDIRKYVDKLHARTGGQDVENDRDYEWTKQSIAKGVPYNAARFGRIISGGLKSSLDSNVGMVETVSGMAAKGGNRISADPSGQSDQIGQSFLGGIGESIGKMIRGKDPRGTVSQAVTGAMQDREALKKEAPAMMAQGAASFDRAGQDIENVGGNDNLGSKILSMAASNAPDMILSMGIAGLTKQAATQGVKLGAKEIAKGLVKKESRKATMIALGKQVAQSALPDISTLPMGVKSFTMTYQDALSKGADDGEAMAAAFVSSWIESAIESGGVQDVIKQAESGFKAWAKSALGEGAEELWQDWLAPAAEKYLAGIEGIQTFSMDPNADSIINPVRAGTAALGGAVLGGVVGLPFVRTNTDPVNDAARQMANQAFPGAAQEEQSINESASKALKDQLVSNDAKARISETIGKLTAQADQPVKTSTLTLRRYPDKTFEVRTFADGQKAIYEGSVEVGRGATVEAAKSAAGATLSRNQALANAKPIESRNTADMKDTNSHSYARMFPELSDGIKDMARRALGDIGDGTKGEKIYITDGARADGLTETITGTSAVKRSQSAMVDDLQEYIADTGESRIALPRLTEALNNIIAGNEKADRQIEKEVEQKLDRYLVNGTKDFRTGNDVLPNKAYADAKAFIYRSRNMEGKKGFSYSETELADAETALTQHMDRMEKDFGKRPDLKIVEPKKSVQKNIGKLLETVGLRAYYIEATDEGNLAEYYDPNMPDVVFIKNGSKRDMQWAAGHAFFHSLKVNHPSLFKSTVDAFEKSVTAEQIAKYLDTFGDSPAYQERLSKDRDMLMEEMLADEAGNTWLSKGFWQDLMDLSAEAFEKIKKLVDDFFDTIMKGFDNYLYQKQTQEMYNKFVLITNEVQERVLAGKQEGKQPTEYDPMTEKAPVEDLPFSARKKDEKAFVAQIETEAFKIWFEGSKVVNVDGSPKRLYSGHSNAAMYGTKFDPKKATSGAFYATEDPDIASNYASGKMGTLENYENGNQYRVAEKPGGKITARIDNYFLTPEQKQKAIAVSEEMGYDIEDYIKENSRYDADVRKWKVMGGTGRLSTFWAFFESMGENIAYDLEGDGPSYTRQQKNGFEQLMDELGIEWNSYQWAQPGVMAIYLSVKNPLVTSDPFPADLMNMLEKAARRERTESWQDNAHWTKDYPIKKWVADIKQDYSEGGNHGWATQIPEKAVKIIKEFGYDGVKDVGGKLGGSEHEVWLAFDPTQIKSATGNRGTFDSANKDMQYSARRKADIKEAFKDSKVRGEDGKLQEVYHGTENEFFSFSMVNESGRIRKKNGHMFGPGYYFTTKRGDAEGFGSRVMPAFVNITDPVGNEKRIGSDGFDWIISQLYKRNQVDVFYEERIRSQLFDAGRSPSDSIIITSLAQDVDDPTALYRIVNEFYWYDGFAVKEAENETQYVAWFPDQIKSPEGENPVDLTNPDIRYSSRRMEEINKAFKGSIVRNEDGNLTDVYHGTSKSGFSRFSTEVSKYGLFGDGFYFTEDPSLASSYTEKGRGDAKGVYKVYLNIKNAIDMDKPADISAWESAFPDADFSSSRTNVDAYRAAEEYLQDEQYVSWEGREIMQDGIREMGYDGITHIGGNYRGNGEKQHRVWIAFDSEQIKSPYSENPVDLDNPDIRYGNRSREELPEARKYKRMFEADIIPETASLIPDEFKGDVVPVLDLKSETGAIRIPGKAPKAPPSGYKGYSDANLEQKHQENKLQPETIGHKIRSFAMDVYNMATRTYPLIDAALEKNAVFMQEAVRFPKIRRMKASQAERILRDITLRENMQLNADDFNIFERVVQLQDFLEDSQHGLVLPNGWTTASVQDEWIKIQPFINQRVKDALIRRKEHIDKIKDEYIKSFDAIGYDISDKFKRDNYFRHQVLEYLQVKQAASSGSAPDKVSKNRGWTKGREGTSKDINTDYLQAEYEVVFGMLHDTEIATMWKRLYDKYDIRPAVEAKAAANQTDWRQEIPDGYAIHQPFDGNYMFNVSVIPEKIMTDALAKGLVDIGVPVAKVKTMMAMGGKRREYVIPEEYITTMKAVYDEYKNQGPLDMAVKFMLSQWKSLMLTRIPTKVIKYNIRNLSGDVESIFRTHGLKGFAPPMAGRAAKELWEALRFHKFTPELLTYRDMGGLEDNLYTQEIAMISRSKTFKAFTGRRNLNFLKTWDEFSSDMTQYRENIVRYALYLTMRQNLSKSANGLPSTYGASLPGRINGLRNVDERAYQMSKDTVGAYDEVTTMGRWLRGHVFPFWSFKERNMIGFARTIRNAASDVANAASVGKKAAGTLGMVGTISTKGAVIIGKTMIHLFGFSLLLSLLNMLNPNDDELSDDIQKTPHLTLWKGEDGQVRYFSRIGVMSDILEWFGLDTLPADLRDLAEGKTTAAQIGIGMLNSPINVVYGMLTPFFKTPLEAVSGQSRYPDVFSPRAIRDGWEYAANSFGVGKAYKYIAGKPVREGYIRSLEDAFLYRSDPEEQAYYKSLDLKRMFQEQVLKEAPFKGGAPTEKANALYYYKQALKYKDADAAKKYFKEYATIVAEDAAREMKITGKQVDVAKKIVDGLTSSLDSLSPVYGLSADTIPAYVNWLQPKDRETVKKGMEYFGKVVGGGQ